MAKQTVDPWNVEVKSEDGHMEAIDYDHIITQFGCQKYTEEHTARLARLTGKQPHILLRRGLAFAHRDFDKILDAIENKQPFYLYTGRGPSSGSMHIGHSIPFLVCKYFQDIFDVSVVIQMTDDEKYLCKDLTLEEAQEYCTENIKDIISFGFNPSITYIFSNFKSAHLFKYNTLKLSKSISLNEAMKVFGFDINTSIGMIEFPARQIAAAFASTFPFIADSALCLIPCAVDQDPYFRLARDKAFAMGAPKPASLYFCLLPDLQGVNKKMSASDPKSSIFLSDDPETIKEKIHRYAYSGGGKTKAEHQLNGGNTAVDVPFQYLRFFLPEDEELQKIESEYSSGTMLTSAMKSKCIEIVQRFVREFQHTRRNIGSGEVELFMSLEKFKK